MYSKHPEALNLMSELNIECHLGEICVVEVVYWKYLLNIADVVRWLQLDAMLGMCERYIVCILANCDVAACCGGPGPAFAGL